MTIGTIIEPTLITARAPIPAIATSGPASSGREIDATPFSVSFVPMARPRSCGVVVSAIKATAATDVRIYGSLMANITNGANVSFLTGSNRFEVSTDVK